MRGPASSRVTSPEIPPHAEQAPTILLLNSTGSRNPRLGLDPDPGDRSKWETAIKIVADSYPPETRPCSSCREPSGPHCSRYSY